MTLVPQGTYRISLPGDQFLTVKNPGQGEIVVIDKPTTDVPGEQEWFVEHGESGVKLRNIQYDILAGFQGAPEAKKPIIAQRPPPPAVEFQTELKGPQPNHYLVYVNNGQQRLYLYLATESGKLALTADVAHVLPWLFKRF